MEDSWTAYWDLRSGRCGISSWTCETFRSGGLFFCTVATFSLVLRNQPKMPRQSILSNVAETLGRESIWQILVGGIGQLKPSWIHVVPTVVCGMPDWIMEHSPTGMDFIPTLWTSLDHSSWEDDFRPCQVDECGVQCERPGRALLAKPTDGAFFNVSNGYAGLSPNLLLLLHSSGCGGLPRVWKLQRLMFYNGSWPYYLILYLYIFLVLSLR